jgi:hypothetical protein
VNAWPPLSELLPQAGPMRLLECVEAHGGLLARALSARHAAGRGDTLAFGCAVEDVAGGPPLAEGRLNVLLLDELSAAGANT